MINKYYNYPYKELWNEHAFDSRMSPLIPLTGLLGRLSLEKHRIEGKPEGERRTEGQFDPKANALTYPELTRLWEEKGLHYHCTSMGFGWVAMVPVGHMGLKGYDDEMDTLIVLPNVDSSDPNWCMYILEKYHDCLEEAADKRFAVLFVTSDRADTDHEYISIIQEAIVIFHLNYRRFFLDVSPVCREGIKLADIPGFKYPAADGDPDATLATMGGLEVLPISGMWTNRDSLTHRLVRGHAYSNLAYNYDSLINSAVGRDLAFSMSLEYLYDDAEDPLLMKYWDDMGLSCAFHEKKGEQWISFVPKGALEDSLQKLPLVCIMQEVNRFDPHQAITGFACFLRYQEIAAQGECMLIYFALESLDDNDLLSDIIEDAQKLYPVDPSRVYVTGHSHNGRFAAEYARRHQRQIAAVATLGNEPGQLSPAVTSGFFVVTDEQLRIQASADMPLVDVSGLNERNSQFPLSTDAPDVRPGQWVALDTFEKRADSWQRRLYSSRCPMRSAEEIAATRESSHTAERVIGVPADSSEVLTLDKSENYIVDIRNQEGRDHLRIIALGNMPHMVTPLMIELSWSFLRRFARDPETGACIELY